MLVMTLSLLVGFLRSLLTTFALFIALTIYGAMWSGAQDENGNGWFIALLWSMGIVLVATLTGLVGPRIALCG